MIESQIEYAISCLKFIDSNNVEALEVHPEVQKRYNDRIQENMRGTVWTNGGCASWYQDSRGGVTTLWPNFTYQFWRSTKEMDPTDYIVRGRLPSRQPVSV